MSSAEEEEEIVIVPLLSEEEQKKNRKTRRFCNKRMIHGEFRSLYPDLLEDEAKCFDYFLMTYGRIMTVLDMLGLNLSREDTCFREAVGPKERLALCLR
jgi:hypothetical protein